MNWGITPSMSTGWSSIQTQRSNIAIVGATSSLSSMMSSLSVPPLTYKSSSIANYPTWPLYVSLPFLVLTLLISVVHVSRHLIYNHSSTLRRPLIRILGMVPIYAIEAYIGLLQPEYMFFYDIIRDWYESAVIYSFLQFLYSYLGTKQRLTEILVKKSPTFHYAPVSWFLSPWNSHQFIFHTRVGVLQYVFIKCFLAFITFVLAVIKNNDATDNQWEVSSVFTYISLINNVSQTWALYCLVLFYQQTKENLARIRPMAKFICVKAVIFFTFWQSIFISFAFHFGYLQTNLSARGLQNLCISLEMFLASIAHLYAFPSDEFSQGLNREYDEESEGTLRRVMAVIYPSDFVHEVRELRVMRKEYAKVITDDSASANHPNVDTSLGMEREDDDENEHENEEILSKSNDEFGISGKFSYIPDSEFSKDGNGKNAPMTPDDTSEISDTQSLLSTRYPTPSPCSSPHNDSNDIKVTQLR